MADSVILVTWKRPIVGRERQALELYPTAMSTWQKAVDAGNIQSFEPVFLAQNPGELGGFFLIRGDGPKLDAFRRSPEFHGLLPQMLYCLDGVSVYDGYVGEGIRQVMTEYGKVVSRG
jgi:hypothetical protein